MLLLLTREPKSFFCSDQKMRRSARLFVHFSFAAARDYVI